MSRVHPQNIAAVLEERGIIKEGERYENEHLMNVIEKVNDVVEALSCLSGTYQKEGMHAFSVAFGFHHSTHQQSIFSAILQTIEDLAEGNVKVDGRNRQAASAAYYMNKERKRLHFQTQLPTT